jgi:hypothetical protein
LREKVSPEATDEGSKALAAVGFRAFHRERIFDPSPPGSAGTLSRKGRGI